MKVIVIGGYPGSGKSTIVKEMLSKLVDDFGHIFTMHKYGKLVPYMASDSLIVLGTYSPGQQFPGTDRMAMNAQPEVQQFLLDYAEMLYEEGEPERIVLYEGDRLFNTKMLNFIKASHMNLRLCIVQAAQQYVEERRQARSVQNESWRKGRQTKVDKIALQYPVAHYLKNNNMQEQVRSVQALVDEVRGVVEVSNPESKIKGLWT